MSRPKQYTPELGDLVCSHISQGKSLAKICSEHKTLPSPRTIYRWLREEDEFRQMYEVAKTDQAHFMAESIIDIADDGTNDWIEQSGNYDAIRAYKLNGESVQRSRLRVDARKWIAARLLPKKYGDRLDTERPRPAGYEDLSQFSREELKRRLEQLRRKYEETIRL